MQDILRTENTELQATIDQVVALSTTLTSILIQGETGTGKTELAERIHKHSGLTGEFVVVNCGELVDTLFEAQMFGSKKGAFTGSSKDEKGLISLANNGTLCLDEVQNLTSKGQQSLLRVLDRKKIRPVGAKTEESVSFRLLATSNSDLLDKIQDGMFREDLYFRICEHTVTMPPLRDRTEDLRALAEDLQKDLSEERGTQVKEIAPDTWEAIYSYDWRGNIRELKNKIVTATIRAGNSPNISSKHMFEQLVLESMAARYGLFEVLGFSKDKYPTMKSVMNKVRYLYIHKLMTENNGNASQACRKGGMTRSTLYKIAKSLDLDLTQY